MVACILARRYRSAFRGRGMWVSKAGAEGFEPPFEGYESPILSWLDDAPVAQGPLWQVGGLTFPTISF
jgi:hypothetical protein